MDSADEEETLHNLIGKFITAITSSPSAIKVDSWESVEAFIYIHVTSTVELDSLVVIWWND